MPIDVDVALNAELDPIEFSWVSSDIQLYHLGLWFADATQAGNVNCPNTPTPFDGDHQAGIQVLNTSSFADGRGPLHSVK